MRECLETEFWQRGGGDSGEEVFIASCWRALGVNDSYFVDIVWSVRVGEEKKWEGNGQPDEILYFSGSNSRLAKGARAWYGTRLRAALRVLTQPRVAGSETS